MNELENKEDSWIRKLPTVIVVLAVLIFVIVAFTNHNQYKKWKAEQSELTGKVEQTGMELDLLREAHGSLQEVTKKVETLGQQRADMTAALAKLHEDKNSTESTLAKLQQELRNLHEQVSAGRNEAAKLMQENETLNSTNQRLREDILNKKGVLDSIVFLQRQKPLLEQNIQNLKTQNELAAQEGLEQQAKLEALQNEIKEGEAAIQKQKESLSALRKELSELTETVKELSSQKEKLVMLDDHQKKIEYLKHLQQQKESLEISINNLLEMGKVLEDKNLQLQQIAPTR